MNRITLPRARKVILEITEWSAGRLVIAETAYLKRTILAARTGLDRDVIRAEEARELAVLAAESLSDDVADLFEVGMSATGIEIAERTAERIESARALIIAAEAHAGRIVPEIPMACKDHTPWVKGESALIEQLANQPGSGGFLAAVVAAGVLILLHGWLAVETYVRGRRDGRRESMVPRKPAVEALEWEDNRDG